MYRVPAIFILLIICSFTLRAQEGPYLDADTIPVKKTLIKADTVKSVQPVAPKKEAAKADKAKPSKGLFAKKEMSKADSIKKNKPKSLAVINGQKAFVRALMVPGLGHFYNGLTPWRTIKLAAIYAGGTALTLALIDNNRQYHVFLAEAQYRDNNNGQPPPGSPYAKYTTDGIKTAKDLYRRNKEITIFSLVALYTASVIDAYVDARLKYFNVDEKLSIRVSPTLIAPGGNYFAQVPTPGLKITIGL